jgi:filamentous hemagglutinin family protein
MSLILPAEMLLKCETSIPNSIGVALAFDLTSPVMDIILNEVCSTDRSVLKGALEVFGKNAAVAIANPNGFYCDKCSFINTSKLTMVSGRSEINR